MLFEATYNSPIGILKIVCNETAVVRLERVVGVEKHSDFPLLLRVQQELDEYFLGKRKDFTFPIELHGTPFQCSVWYELRKIPYGQVSTYGEIAKRIGRPKASRAVGSACNKNKLLLVVPCHRVVGATGSLVGFALGLDVKQTLLSLETKKE